VYYVLVCILYYLYAYGSFVNVLQPVCTCTRCVCVYCGFFTGDVSYLNGPQRAVYGRH